MLREGFLILSVLASSLAQSGSPPDSPCPAVFRYSFSPPQGWHGIVSIVPPLTFSEVLLKLRLSVAKYKPDAGVGKLEILGGDTEVQNIANRASRHQRQKIQYIVVFPSYEQFPHISSVKINEYEFCPSPAYNDARGAIDLEFTLKTGLSVADSNGNEFSVDGANIQPEQPSQQQPQKPQQHQQPQQPQQPQQQQTQTPQQWPHPVQAPQRPQQPNIPVTPPPTPTPLDPHDYEYDDPEDVSPQYQVNSADCGKPAVLTVNKLVVRGEDTRLGEWPWMAAIFTAPEAKFHGAGSLISRKHVITAAHCVFDRTTRRAVSPSTLTVFLGRYNLDNIEPQQQEMEISKIVTNPNYTDSKKQDYDIGLIILKEAATINDAVRTVCLWDESMKESVISKIGLAPGWGKDENGVTAKALKLARMPVVSQSECVESDPEFFSAIISEKTFCAGYTNGTSLCMGDSGGGLFFYRKNPKTGKETWFIRGVVSLSKNRPNEILPCGIYNYVVFTDIPKLRAWINLIVTPPPTAPSQPRPTPTSLDPHDYEYDDPEDVSPQYQVNSADCGKPAVMTVNKLVVRGEDTKVGEWPWLAAIFTAPEAKFQCAGSLISRRHVITAAHCVFDRTTRRAVSPSTLTVFLGRYNLDDIEPQQQEMEISQIMINPKYTKSKKQDYNIGLIFLKEAVTINDVVRTVCLWDESMTVSVTNKIGSAPGWGKDENGVTAKALKLARMPVVSQSECVESDPEFFSAIISEKTFCAGYTNGTSLCNGDSGGGLFFYLKNPKTGKEAWFVRGIVSHSKVRPKEFLSCGIYNYVLFTDIPTVRAWINLKLVLPTVSR